jgi:hypothetical protein
VRGWSFYGCGVMQLGLRRDDDDLLETTRWVTIFFVPVIPLSRWRVRYVGIARQVGPDNDESFVFDPIDRLPLDPYGVIQTALCGWCLFAIAVGPAVGCVFGIRRATTIQMALALGACCWPLLVTIWVQRRWRVFLERPPGSWPNT